MSGKDKRTQALLPKNWLKKGFAGGGSGWHDVQGIPPVDFKVLTSGISDNWENLYEVIQSIPSPWAFALFYRELLQNHNTVEPNTKLYEMLMTYVDILQILAFRHELGIDLQFESIDLSNANAGFKGVLRKLKPENDDRWLKLLLIKFKNKVIAITSPHTLVVPVADIFTGNDYKEFREFSKILRENLKGDGRWEQAFGFYLKRSGITNKVPGTFLSKWEKDNGGGIANIGKENISNGEWYDFVDYYVQYLSGGSGSNYEIDGSDKVIFVKSDDDGDRTAFRFINVRTINYIYKDKNWYNRIKGFAKDNGYILFLDREVWTSKLLDVKGNMYNGDRVAKLRWLYPIRPSFLKEAPSWLIIRIVESLRITQTTGDNITCEFKLSKRNGKFLTFSKEIEIVKKYDDVKKQKVPFKYLDFQPVVAFPFGYPKGDLYVFHDGTNKPITVRGKIGKSIYEYRLYKIYKVNSVKIDGKSIFWVAYGYGDDVINSAIITRSVFGGFDGDLRLIVDIGTIHTTFMVADSGGTSKWADELISDFAVSLPPDLGDDAKRIAIKRFVAPQKSIGRHYLPTAVARDPDKNELPTFGSHRPVFILENKFLDILKEDNIRMNIKWDPALMNLLKAYIKTLIDVFLPDDIFLAYPRNVNNNNIFGLKDWLGLENIQLIAEHRAVAAYYRWRNAAPLKADNLIIMDIGGGTSDITFWWENKPQLGFSIQFAGQNILTESIIEHAEKTKSLKNLLRDLNIDTKGDMKILEKVNIGLLSLLNDRNRFNQLLTKYGMANRTSPFIRLFLAKIFTLFAVISLLFAIVSNKEKKSSPGNIRFFLAGNGSRLLEIIINGIDKKISEVINSFMPQISSQDLPLHKMEINIEFSNDRKLEVCKGINMALNNRQTFSADGNDSINPAYSISKLREKLSNKDYLGALIGSIQDHVSAITANWSFDIEKVVKNIAANIRQLAGGEYNTVNGIIHVIIEELSKVA